MADKWLVWVFLYISPMIISQVVGFQLTILHTNDVHGHIQEMNGNYIRCLPDDSKAGKCYGGMERLKTKVDEMRAKYPDSLLLDGGDQYQGTSLFYIYRGQIMAHFMNILGYDAMALGNHEFDDGPPGLVPFLTNVTFPVLSCNIDVTNTPEMATVGKTKVIEVSGQKIGIVGYTTSETPSISFPDTAKFSDEIEPLQVEVDKLIAKGVNKIIALGHSGYRKDQEIAKKVRGLDIVVGGHTNTFLYTGDAPSTEVPEGLYPTVIRNDNGQDVLVVQDFAFGKYLGFLQVDFDDKGKPLSWNGNPILMDSSVPKDSSVTQEIEVYLPKVRKEMLKKIGLSLVALDGSKSQCRVKECNLGNLFADAMVYQNLRYVEDSNQWNQVSIAMTNAGGIRASVPRGDVTPADITAAMPFRNTVDVVELTGKAIVKVLEYSASGWVNSGDYFGPFLQVSGLRVVYDMRRDVGKRVVRVHTLCTQCLVPEYRPLNLTHPYRVLTSSYLIAGGDGFSVIKENMGDTHIIGDQHYRLLLDYFTENTPVVSKLEGRIQFLEDIESSKMCAAINEAHQVKLSLLIITFCAFVVYSILM